MGAEESNNPSSVVDGIPMDLSERVVLHLCDWVFNAGQTLYTNNFYSSTSLAKSLLARKIHSVSTLHSNQKNTPKSVTMKKLVKGERNFCFSIKIFLVGAYLIYYTFFCYR